MGGLIGGFLEGSTSKISIGEASGVECLEDDDCFIEVDARGGFLVEGFFGGSFWGSIDVSDLAEPVSISVTEGRRRNVPPTSLGGDSIEKYQFEFLLEKSLEFCLQIPYISKFGGFGNQTGISSFFLSQNSCQNIFY